MTIRPASSCRSGGRSMGGRSAAINGFASTSAARMSPPERKWATFISDPIYILQQQRPSFRGGNAADQHCLGFEAHFQSGESTCHLIVRCSVGGVKRTRGRILILDFLL